MGLGCRDFLTLSTLAVLWVFASGAASAETLLWARKSTFGGTSAIVLGNDGEIYCTGCDPNNYGRIPIVRDATVEKATNRTLEPWMSTLWVVLFRVDTGNTCPKGDWYTISLNTHALEQVDTDVFGCRDVTVSVTDHDLGMDIRFTDAKGRTVIRHVR